MVKVHGMKKLNIALVGLGFGACFHEIYLKHPDIDILTLCDANPVRLDKYKHLSKVKLVTSLEEVLRDPTIDGVHLNSGIPDHARHSLAIMKAGKHCACTVPMATSLEDIFALIETVKTTAKNYMMMETVIYSREFLRACEMRDNGVFGHLQLMRGAHYQDMERWPPYWAGLPPMWYATHAIAPLLAFANTRARKVHCFGSGFMREELKAQYNNPYPVETAIFELEREIPLAMEVTRSLFHTNHGYHEGFNIYGEKASLDWPFHDEPLMFFGQDGIKQIGIPDYQHLLPAEIAPFTGAVGDGRDDHPSVKHGGGHGGSHPHLVHEFVRSIIENRPPAIDVIHAANWTAPGICAHTSAMNNGATVEIPRFS